MRGEHDALTLALRLQRENQLTDACAHLVDRLDAAVGVPC